MIHPGLKGRSEGVVTLQNTAIAAGSGTLPVFGTPYMAALMENAASESLSPYLEEGQSSVGVKLDISHSSATPVGMLVWVDSEVTAVEGKKIVFTVSAFDECGPIGKGVHERFIIGIDRFMDKCNKKKSDAL